MERKDWIDIVIRILQGLIALLGALGSAAAIAQGVRPASEVAAFGLETATWFWVLIGGLGGVSVLTWLFQMWRKKRDASEDERLEQVLEFVEWILDALEKETGRLLREIPQATVEQAARDVYRQVIARTPLSFVPEEVFVGLVVDTWRKVAGIESAVRTVAIRAQAAMPSG